MGIFGDKNVLPDRTTVREGRIFGQSVHPDIRCRSNKALTLTATFLLTFSGFGVITALPAYATNPSGVTNVTASPTSLTAGASSTYTVDFTATSGLANGTTTITLSGPPTGPIFALTAGDYTVNGSTVTVTPVNNGSDNNNVTITTPITVSPGGSVAVVASDVQNPKIAGSYSVSVATSLDTLTAASAPDYTISAAQAAQLVPVTGSSGQSAAVDTKFSVPLMVSVEDQYGNPELGGSYDVTFTAPTTGASGTFANGTNTTSVSSGSGTAIATSTSFTANATVGTYQVKVTSGSLTSTSLTETNISGGTAPSYWPMCSGSSGSDCVISDTYNGGSLPSGVTLNVSDQNGVQIQFQCNGNYELDTCNVTNSGQFAVSLNLGTINPTEFIATGTISSETISSSAGDYILNFTAQPAPSSWSESPGCSINSCPQQADVDYKSFLIGFAGAMPTPSGTLSSTRQTTFSAFRTASEGTWVATNAQSFSWPTLNPSTGALQFQLAAPHLTAASTSINPIINTGTFTAFLPSSLLTYWGVTATNLASQLNTSMTDSSGTTTQVSPTVTAVTGGINGGRGCR